MKIRKIFSNNDNPQEILYSVTLNELEFRIFSEKIDKEELGRNLKIGGTLTGIAGTLVGANALKKKLSISSKAIPKAILKTEGDTQMARELLQRFGKTSKKVKKAKLQSNLSLGLGIAGTGSYIAGKIIRSKAKKDKNVDKR